MIDKDIYTDQDKIFESCLEKKHEKKSTANISTQFHSNLFQKSEEEKDKLKIK